MTPHPALSLLLALQQPAAATTTPPSHDTAGYWQQRVGYRIVAKLDEERGLAVARGTMVYVNNSPDTLREMYVHQHLNAFRPGSKWTAADARENRVRFQRLREPDFAYERFTAAPTFRRASAPEGAGVPVTPEYPGAPDSTVARFALPEPLPPGDSLVATFEWEARPSTLPRRQGRKGRSFDFAQWFPKVAVYDRGGWEPNPLVPAGEFYGEFGTYDVTLVVPESQVIGSTGVPVSGDPGWERARRWGDVHPTSGAYRDVPPAPSAPVPIGFKAVRFVARDVHHFGWSTSPDYRYEGGVYARPPSPRMRFPVWDTVAVHVLYRPGDEEAWGNGRAVGRTITALRWLEKIYGPYGYPQVTNLHRIEGGGTEFPMMMMNGSAGQGLILHEGGHIYTYGMLASNEWRSGWMDEGLTSYQTSWFEGATLADRAAKPSPQQRPNVKGYAARAVRPSTEEEEQLEQFRLDLLGRAEPIGTAAKDFNEFGIYNSMIYTRAEHMYGQLRDVMGDSAFARFLRDYYARWSFRHVDELAMRAAAERAHGAELGWFFDQWVHRTGLIDYALGQVTTTREGSEYVTRARIRKVGEYFHPMPVGARVGDRWVIARGQPLERRQVVEIRTSAEPSEVRLDPLNTTEDWDWRDNVQSRGWWPPFERRTQRVVFDWPFLEQRERGRELIALAPLAWYSDAGGANIAFRGRSNYQGLADLQEAGLALALRDPGEDTEAYQFWLRHENPTRRSRPAMGLSVGIWSLDGIGGVQLGRTWDRSQFIYARGRQASVTLGALLLGRVRDSFRSAYVPEGWSDAWTGELSGAYAARWPNGASIRVGGLAGWADTPGGSLSDEDDGFFARAELDLRRLFLHSGGRGATLVRAFGGANFEAPAQRRVHVSAQDPVQTFWNHWYRPRGAILKREHVNYLPLGGAGLRAYNPYFAPTHVAAANLEHARRLFTFALMRQPALGMWGSAFTDVGIARDARHLGGTMRLGDAGLALALRGRLYDREVRLRADFPLYVGHPELAFDRPSADRRTGFRWSFSLNDLW